MKKQIALKIDVDTYRGTREGVPALLRTLDRHQTRATFLFSLGPDHTGRALRRAFRPGFLKKVQRTSVIEHYGLKTLLYGVLLCNARAMGEFGAVSVVSGHIRGLTDTLPLHVENLYNEYDFVAAFAVASLLTLLALLTLALKLALEWRAERARAFEG